ncbi:YaaA family protein [Parafrigoribacterium soli]|uniref:YaaA family protein n=1 Tax=Parafrigoribacterium soli TaxID=3144663 RepID=UPI0032EBBD3C
MLILLPPSETKRDGGVAGSALDLASLRFPGLSRQRRSVVAALRKLAGNRASMAAALHLGPTQHFEVQRNRELRTSAVMPALDRYTGVLFDGLDAGSLPAGSRSFALEHVVIHSALFGLIGAADAIPAYRLSHDSRLPDLSLKRTWRDAIAAQLSGRSELILDLRSEAYVELGPSVGAPRSYFLRVVSEGPDGTRRALNHFNKKGKGEFVRELALAAIDHEDVDSLLRWAADSRIRLSLSAGRELELVV